MMKFKYISLLFTVFCLGLNFTACNTAAPNPAAESETTAETETAVVKETSIPVPTKRKLMPHMDYLQYIRDSLPKEGQLVSAGDDYALGISPEGKVLYAGLAAEDVPYENFGTPYQAVDFEDVVQVSAGAGYYASALRADGTIVMTKMSRLASNMGQREAEQWTDIVSFSASDYTTAGVKRDGSIIVAGGRDPYDPASRYYKAWDKKYPVPDWNNMKQFFVTRLSFLAGINQNGELVHAENYTYEDWYSENDAAPSEYWVDYYWKNDEMPLVWNHLVDFAVGNEVSAGVKEDGQIVVGGPDELYDRELEQSVPMFRPQWWDYDIVDVEFMDSMLVGMRTNGTLRLFETNSVRQIDPVFFEALEWTDLVDISVGRSMIIGVKSDGTVMAVGYPSSVVEEINRWKVSPCKIDRDIPHETS